MQRSSKERLLERQRFRGLFNYFFFTDRYRTYNDIITLSPATVNENLRLTSLSKKEKERKKDKAIRHMVIN